MEVASPACVDKPAIDFPPLNTTFLLSAVGMPPWSATYTPRCLLPYVRANFICAPVSKAAAAVASVVRSCHHISPADSPLETEAVLQSLVNHEQQGIPDRAGAKGSDAFDLVV